MSDGALRGMILAAGYGTRLAPISDHVPKPLLPVPGGTVLDRAVAALDAAGVGPIAVNTHHLAEQVAGHLAARPDAGRFTVFHETGILGTGGALDGARGFLAGAERFLLHNGDVLSDVDLAALLADHERSGALATLLLVDWPAVNSVEVDEQGAVVGIAGTSRPPGSGRRLTYGGIGVFERRLLDDIGPGFSSLIDPLVRALMSTPGSVRGLAPANAHWSDLGTLTSYLAACRDEGALAAGNVRLDPITGHASDRRFWRLASGGWSAVAMESPPEDAGFDHAVAISAFLHGEGLGAPAVLSVDPDERTVLWEDVGRHSLNSRVTGPDATPLETARLYSLVVDHLLRFQTVAEAAHASCPMAVERTLDRDLLAWETRYFAENFLVGVLGTDHLEDLADDFARLNDLVAAQPLVPLHRDLQSENIFMADDTVRLVDVQDMRLGPLGYDLASLLWDPYVSLPQNLRNDLTASFARTAAPRHGLTADEVVTMVTAAALQRLMQALGAYAFIGTVKGRPGFLAHRPRGLAHLRTVLVQSPIDLPTLVAVVGSVPEL